MDAFGTAGTKHLDHIAREWLDHHHAERPHQGVKNELLAGPANSYNFQQCVALKRSGYGTSADIAYN